MEESVLRELDIALNEAEVAGLRLGPEARVARLLLYVLALPEVGPMEVDRRRALVLSGVSAAQILLRPVRYGACQPEFAPAVSLADMDAVHAFFASLSSIQSMYGWRFFDDETLTADWPDQVSLDLRLNHPIEEPLHSMYWFAECDREESGQRQDYDIEGVVWFHDVSVERADGTPIPVDAFTADGRRWWDALRADDERVGVAAQQALDATPLWHQTRHTGSQTRFAPG